MSSAPQGQNSIDFGQVVYVSDPIIIRLFIDRGAGVLAEYPIASGLIHATRIGAFTGVSLGPLIVGIIGIPPVTVLMRSGSLRNGLLQEQNDGPKATTFAQFGRLSHSHPSETEEI